MSSVVVVENQQPAAGSSTSAVSWAAILAGGVGALALTVVLLILGSALGFASASPWSGEGASAATIGIGAAIWLVVVQWFSSAVGGYLSGRLRTKWVSIHTHEAFFRDTAHGFLAWAAATIVMTVLVAASATSAISGAASVTAGVAGQSAKGAAQSLPSTSYFADMLYRADNPPSAETPQAARLEAVRILTNAATEGQMAAADREYLATLTARNTGMTREEAKARVDSVLQQVEQAKVKAKQVADDARRLPQRWRSSRCCRCSSALSSPVWPPRLAAISGMTTKVSRVEYRELPLPSLGQLPIPAAAHRHRSQHTSGWRQ